jgi:hypothetical protein
LVFPLPFSGILSHINWQVTFVAWVQETPPTPPNDLLFLFYFWVSPEVIELLSNICSQFFSLCLVGLITTEILEGFDVQITLMALFPLNLSKGVKI